MVQIHSVTPSDSAKRPNSSQSSLEDKLRETLQDEAQFESLMEWMYREFSSEALLSLIEFVQFKVLLKEYEQKADDDEEMRFYSEIPKSTIVHAVSESTAGKLEETTGSQNGSARLPPIADALYKKYIERHSELEINISYSLRNRWDVLHFKNYPEDDMGELVNAVDEVISEMLKYIRHSFMRFDLDRQ